MLDGRPEPKGDLEEGKRKYTLQISNRNAGVIQQVTL